jgi:hypothetical protein
LVTEAAIYLAQRNLEPTMLEGLKKEGPIDRSVGGFSQDASRESLRDDTADGREWAARLSG